MNNNSYGIKTFSNGLKMLSANPINNTGIAKAYYTIKDNPIGHSTDECGPFSCNIYKKYPDYDYALGNGIKDFNLCCEALEIAPKTVATNRLTYATDDVRIVTAADMLNYNILDEKAAPHYDGLITDEKEITLMTYAADCILVNFLDVKNRVIGACHCSWTTTLKGIIENEVKTFINHYNSNPADIIAYIWPGISEEFFEVGEDCAEQFSKSGFDKYINISSYAKPHIDLQGVNKQILLNTGLHEKNIYIANNLCTYRDEKWFHSYRRGPINPDTKTHLNGMNGCFIKLV